MGKRSFSQSDRPGLLSTRLNNSRPLIPASCEVTFPMGDYQGDLFESLDGRRVGRLPASHVLLGTLYERIGLAIYGGTHQDNRWVLNGHREQELIVPDVVTPEGPIEYKARFEGTEHLLKDRQVAKYWLDQTESPGDSFRFMFFDHPIRRIGQFYGNRAELVERIVDGTSAGYVLPLRAVIALHALPIMNYETELCSRNDSKLKPSTRLHASLFYRLMNDPEGVLTEARLDPGEFELNFWRSPEGLNLEGREIRSFPIVEVKDTVPYNEWPEIYRPDKALLSPTGIKIHYSEMARLERDREYQEEIETEREAIQSVERGELVCVVGEKDDDLPF